MATYAIGDIHGWREPLDDVLGRIAPRLAGGDTVVFLGDYIDRGDDSRGVVDAILAFRAGTAARVVCLLGNHEEWLLKAMHDPRTHSWLLGMDGYTTIRSYSPAAEQTIRRAARDAGGDLYGGGAELPYDAFFAAMPDAHRQFFQRLERYHESADCLCTHAGVDPANRALADQARTLIWGHPQFPEDYRGERAVVYGHTNDADLDAAGWPWPRVVGNTYGLDTVGHGVLSALRMPGAEVIQSARYDYAVRRDAD
ncbi:MAG: metallophosphoesterase [Vicinamibacterales bacterium]